MRVTIILLLVSILQTFANDAYSQKTRLSFDFSNKKLVDALYEIEEQTEFYFLYNDNLVDTDRRISLSVDGRTIDQVLDRLFSGTDIKYTITDRKIILTPNDITVSLQQQKSISGKVTDSSGQPLPGVTVIVKGTTQGTITNADGNYSLSGMMGDATLVFSFVGMKPEEVSIAGKQTINVTLFEERIGIEEVVAIGYGTQKRQDLTGAISSVGANEIKKVPVTNVGQALQGRMSGVMVTNNDGTPGAGVQVLIRGIGSFGDNTPLYVVDGYPGTSISTLNPQDIQTIDVLKDASAAAIYGNRAANGVVIITTKRGQQGKMQVSFDATSSVQSEPKTFDVLSAQEFASLATEVADKEGSPVLEEWYSPNSLQTVDWQDIMYRRGFKQNYNIGIRSGSDKALSFLSLGLTDHKGIVEFSNYKRYNVSLNQDYIPVKWLKSSTMIRYAYTDSKTVFGSGQGGVGKLARLIPTMTGNPLTDLPEDDNGNYGYYSKTETAVANSENVYARSKLNDQKGISHNLNGSTVLEIYPVDGLTLKTNFGINYASSSGYNFNPLDDRVTVTRLATYSQYANNSFEYLWENTLNYSFTLNNHNVDLLAGTSLQENCGRYLNVSSEGVMSDGLRNLGSMKVIKSLAGYQQKWSLSSYFGRATYKFGERYILTGTVRWDGSSRFAKGNRWGTFPSVSGAWKVKEERFLKNTDVISNLKLRASYGEAGNQNIGLFQYQASYTSGSRNSNYGYIFGQNKVYTDGLVQSFLPNQKLKWETSKQTDIGVDVGFFNNKLSMTADFYIKKSFDFLLKTKMPAQTGFLEATRNVGSIKNSGFEFLIQYRNSETPLKYSISLNLTTVKNKIEELAPGMEAVSNLQSLDFPTVGNTSWAVFSKSRIGGSIGDFFGFKTDGIIQTQSELDALNQNARDMANDPNVWYNTSGTAPGDRRFVDVDGNGRITDDDRVILGSPIPDFYGGVNFTGEYKNFDCNVFFTFSYGNEILNFVGRDLVSMNVEGGVGMQNIGKDFYDNRWKGEGTSDKYPRAVWSDVGGNSRVSDVFVEDGSYLRLKNVELGYTIPSTVMPMLNNARLRIFTSIQNVFTVTDYSGLDPEIGQSVNSSGVAGGVTASGLDVGIYPYSRFFTVGLGLQF